MALLSNEWIYYRYDSLSRLSERDVAGILTEHQTYLAGTSGNTTTLPETFYTTARGGTAKLSGFQYGYDALGNITKITDLTDHSYTQYTYDQQGQVTSAKAYNASGTLQKTEAYTYDSYGNAVLLRRKQQSCWFRNTVRQRSQYLLGQLLLCQERSG